MVSIAYRGSFGDLANKELYYHMEPLDLQDKSVSDIDMYYNEIMQCVFLVLFPYQEKSGWRQVSDRIYSLLVIKTIIIYFQFSIVFIMFCFFPALQLDQPHALYLASEYSPEHGSCGESYYCCVCSCQFFHLVLL